MSIEPLSRPSRIVAALAPLLPAGENSDRNARFGRERIDRREMLACENFCRCHQRRLSASFDGTRHGQQRYDCLA